MPDKHPDNIAHVSFPITSSALQRTSLKPGFNYLEINHAREFVARLNSPQPAFSAGELAACGWMGKACLAVIQNYLDSNQTAFAELDHYLQDKMGLEATRAALLDVIAHFPPRPAISALDQKSFFIPAAARHNYYYSLLLILVAEYNPAFRSRDGVFTSSRLRKSPLFINLISSLRDFFSLQPEISHCGAPLIDFLVEPGQRCPDSIFDQLLCITERWAQILSPAFTRSLLVNLDLFKKGVSIFNPDDDWMPWVVLQAKNVLVWLDQLSSQYGKPLTRLDQIPAKELQILSQRGITALWLVGLWERSPASQQIKVICGNSEAVSSAYSLYDYTIAESLGGEEAFQHLSKSAANFNIRLAADMVPNHTGIDSRWVAEHPEWFLYLDSPPYPGYTFEGVDLSTNPSFSIYLEDHYYDQSDAAVVFKRLDHHSGETRYIYHGNDGTSMPWNDTAQLDFLNPEVREAVIQTILHVARKFPIIRFDAAMTLTKQHYQRLWFPEPGTGSAIPTRAGFSLAKEQFNAKMPEEFWREVVDRVSKGAPGTLLLAEAFWMMEDYFVRDLGLHRVYNSAFMHMLRDEDNKNFRRLIIDTLECDPQILKRYVNFMNNPDEDTALAQFGSGGKYFGTCVMMSTLPGLPMFGHGQIEGLSEKYGMEYKKAYYDEKTDPAFLERHQREIFPLLNKRYLFSEVDCFYIYDYVSLAGVVNEDVFAYSNRSGSEKALVIYHNKRGDTKGYISKSAPVNGNSVDLLSGLGLSSSGGGYLIFRDLMNGLEYIHPLQDLASQGLYVELGAYCYNVFVDFRIEKDLDGSYALLNTALKGKGVPDIHKQRMEILFAPLAVEVSSLTSTWQNEEAFFEDHKQALSARGTERILRLSSESGKNFFAKLPVLFPGKAIDHATLFESFLQRISALIGLFSKPPEAILSPATILLPWSFLADLAPALGEVELGCIISTLSKSLIAIDPFCSEDQESLARKLSLLVSLSTQITDISQNLVSLSDFWFITPSIQEFIGLQNSEGELCFHKESMELLINFTFNLLAIEFCLENSPNHSLTPGNVNELNSRLSRALSALNASKCRVDLYKTIISENLSGK